MKFRQYLAGSVIALATTALSATTAHAACVTDGMPSSKDKPGGYPERALTMVVPYGPAGGSGQVAQAMAQAVSDLTGISINRDHKPGGSGTVGMTAYMASPADGYSVMEHIATVLHMPPKIRIGLVLGERQKADQNQSQAEQAAGPVRPVGDHDVAPPASCAEVRPRTGRAGHVTWPSGSVSLIRR